MQRATGAIMSFKTISYLLSGTLALCLMVPVNAEELAEESDAGRPSQGNGNEVTIEPAKKEAINEFRINGQLYMICINPQKGNTYCLVDADGDGNLETRKNDLTPDFLIPSWVLMRW
jgi:hypothetical protein